MTSKLRVAFEGCCHGELDKIYTQIKFVEDRTKEKIDLLIICGDFQAMRHHTDLHSMACPPKYRRMGDFQAYYDGVKVAPIPTVFIGGNHEASNHLWELYYGGWVAPNIYYLGQSGVIWFRGLRIGGVSGIFHPYDCRSLYHEKVPYDQRTIRSVYHTRTFEIEKLNSLGLFKGPFLSETVLIESPEGNSSKKEPSSSIEASSARPLDIFISHDWPQSIYHYGNTQKLLQIKPYFRDEVTDLSISLY